MHKVIIAVPPIKSKKGYPTCGNNRQFQWFKDPFFAYPITAAIAATMLARGGQMCQWVDAVAAELDDVDFGKVLVQVNPDYIIFECPTPLIKRYNEIINGIKRWMPQVKIILCGEHVTAFPDPKLYQADHIITGGDWPYKVFELLTGKPYPEQAPPHIDRNLTCWWLYAYKNGNFKYLPGTYIMSAFDCFYHECSFCSWAQYYKDYKIRSVEDVLTEVERLICMGFKEIFDDSGTFPAGEWLKEFCTKMYERGYNEHISMGANMRFGVLNQEDFDLLKKAGFRMLLWGFESANQGTLDKLNKGYKVADVKEDLAMAHKAGLESHLTCMFGYPWETYEDAKRTHDVVRSLLINGWADSAQATICIPYPITPLWKECKEQGLLTTENWEEYDMSKAVMKVPFDEKLLFKLQKGIYNTAFHPRFLLRKLSQIRTFNDLKYYMRIGQKVYDRFGNWQAIGK